MIRVLAVIVGLGLGLAGAALVGGTAAHLRLIGAQRVAPWVALLDDRAGIIRGNARVHGAVLGWRLAGIDARGPRWAVDLAGADWRLTGAARVTPGGVRVQRLTGVMPLALLMPGAAGVIALRTGTLDLALPSFRVIAGQVEGRARGLDPAEAVADGAVTATVVDGAWRLVGR